MSYSVSWYRTPVDPRVRAHFFNTRVVNSKYISYITDKGNYIYMAGLKEGNTEVTYINRNLIKDRLLCPWNSSGKNTGVGCHSLLQGIFPTQGSRPRSLALQADFLLCEPPGKPNNRIEVFKFTDPFINWWWCSVSLQCFCFSWVWVLLLFIGLPLDLSPPLMFSILQTKIISFQTPVNLLASH